MSVIFGSGVGEIADDVDGSESVSLTRTRRSVFFKIMVPDRQILSWHATND